MKTVTAILVLLVLCSVAALADPPKVRVTVYGFYCKDIVINTDDKDIVAFDIVVQYTYDRGPNANQNVTYMPWTATIHRTPASANLAGGDLMATAVASACIPEATIISVEVTPLRADPKITVKP